MEPNLLSGISSSRLRFPESQMSRSAVDNHNHIILSTLREMVAAARAKGVREFSVTEHISQFKSAREAIDFGSKHSQARVFKSFDEYEQEFANVEKYSDILINQGLEVDYSPRYETRVGDLVNERKWDILLCSIHEFEDGSPTETKRRWAQDQKSADEHWRQYFDLQQRALESDFIDFQVLSHPVRLLRATSLLPVDFDMLLFELAKTATKRNKALELNGNDLGVAPSLIRRLARACQGAGCQVSLGSDAQRSHQVFRNVPQAMDLVEEFSLQLRSKSR